MTDVPHSNDLPVEQGASRKTIWLIAAVVLVLIGAAVWFRINVAFSTPPEARELGARFLESFEHGKFDAASKLCDPTAVDILALGRVCEGIRGLGEIQTGTSIVGLNKKGKTPDAPKVEFSQEVDYATAKKTYSATVEKIDGTWKVTAYSIN